VHFGATTNMLNQSDENQTQNNNQMKKTVLLVGSLSLLALAVATVSCKKDKFNGCVCTYPEILGGHTQEFPPEAVEAAGAKESCGELGKILGAGLIAVTCTNR